MRLLLVLAAGVALVAFLPAVSADDPSLSLPDPQPVADAADGAANETRNDALATHQANVAAAASAAQQAQLLQVPASQAEAAAGNNAGFASRSVARAGAVAGAGIDFAAGAAGQKITEGGAVLKAADSVGGAAVDAAGSVLFAALDVACTHPVIGDASDPQAPTCGEGSLVGRATGAGNATVTQVEGVASAPKGEETLAALYDFLRGLVGGLAP